MATLLSPQHLGVDGKHPFHRHSPLGPYFLVTDQTSQDFSLPTCDISPAELEDQEKLSAQLQPSNNASLKDSTRRCGDTGPKPQDSTMALLTVQDPSLKTATAGSQGRRAAWGGSAALQVYETPAFDFREQEPALSFTFTMHETRKVVRRCS